MFDTAALRLVLSDVGNYRYNVYIHNHSIRASLSNSSISLNIFLLPLSRCKSLDFTSFSYTCYKT